MANPHQWQQWEPPGTILSPTSEEARPSVDSHKSNHWESNDEAATWVAFRVPAQTPPAIVEKLNDDINNALADSGVREQFERIGFSAIGGTVVESQSYVKSEIVKWGEIIRKLELKQD